MAPEEIEGRDFFVGLRGYDRDEVHQFLAEVANQQRSLLAELERARSMPDPAAAAAARDDFEDLGANVAVILRTAKESAAAIITEAEATAANLREEAERYAEERRRAADEYATARRDEADSFHVVAARAAEEAQAEAERRLAEADERIRTRELESNERARVAAVRLQEASDEIQLALLALGDPVDDHEGVVGQSN